MEVHGNSIASCEVHAAHVIKDLDSFNVKYSSYFHQDIPLAYRYLLYVYHDIFPAEEQKTRDQIVPVCLSIKYFEKIEANNMPKGLCSTSINGDFTKLVYGEEMSPPMNNMLFTGNNRLDAWCRLSFIAFLESKRESCA